MNKTAIFDIIKKNVLSVICGVVVLLALLSLLFPLSGMYERFQVALDKQKSAYDTAAKLAKTPRFLPIVGTDPKAPRQPLDVFPNKKVIVAGETAREQVQQQSVKIEDAARQVNQGAHTLLLPGSLPAPGDRLFDFVKAYRNAVVIPPAGQAIDPKNTTNLPMLLGSVMPPDADEVAAEAQKIRDRDFEPRIISLGGKEVNRPQIEAEFQTRIANLPVEMREQRAKSYQLYMDRTALSTNPAVLETQTPKAADVWYAQLALWIENDVTDAIVNANRVANATVQNGNIVKLRDPTILVDPVKRLVRLDIPMGPTVFVMDDAMLAAAGAAGQAAAAPQSSAKPAGESGFPLDYTKSPTGRVSNEKWVICRFTLILDVDQRQIPLILDELQRGKLVTVTDVNLAPVDNAVALESGFVYGNAPMVEMTLTCEALFMRSWIAAKPTDPMPPDVRAVLSWSDTTAPGAAAVAARP